MSAHKTTHSRRPAKTRESLFDISTWRVGKPKSTRKALDVGKRRESLFDIEWRRDSAGYELSRDKKRIVRNGGRMVKSPIVTADPPVHRTFINLSGQLWQGEYGELMPIVGAKAPFEDRWFADEADALLAFVNEYGFLGSNEWGDEGEKPGFERTDYLIGVQKDLSAQMAFGPISPGWDIKKAFNSLATQVSVRLMEGYEGRLSVKLLPRTLIDWIWLMALQDLADGVKYDGPDCLYCYKSMPRGPGGYRKQAKCCSDHCRTYFNRLPKDEKQKRLKAAGWLKRKRGSL